MRRSLRVALLLGIGLALAGGAEAQDTKAESKQVREGFWLNVGLGAGSFGCEDCDGRVGGLAGNLSLGGTISQKLRLGVSSDAYVKSEDGATTTLGSLTAQVRFYPSSTGGFFLMGGVGYGTLSVELDGIGSDSESGAAAMLGLGYDIRIGRTISLTPSWTGFAVNTSSTTWNAGQLGLGITIH